MKRFEISKNFSPYYLKLYWKGQILTKFSTILRSPSTVDFIPRMLRWCSLRFIPEDSIFIMTCRKRMMSRVLHEDTCRSSCRSWGSSEGRKHQNRLSLMSIWTVSTLSWKRFLTNYKYIVKYSLWRQSGTLYNYPL